MNEIGRWRCSNCKRIWSVYGEKPQVLCPCGSDAWKMIRQVHAQPTKKARASREKNHYVLRLRGAQAAVKSVRFNLKDVISKNDNQDLVRELVFLLDEIDIQLDVAVRELKVRKLPENDE